MAARAAAAAPAPARTRTRGRPAVAPAPPRRRAAARRSQGTRAGIVWIVLVAGLLAGVVAMNVAVLQLNMTLDRLGRDRADLRARNAALSSQLSSAAAAPKIQALAHARLGLVPAPVNDASYVDLGR